jgi:MarR family 2-MHQ and catechol resistance regulon transcriptional repressor
MHPTNFEIKQCHLAGVRFTRSFTSIWGLTPARLDMIRAIFEPGYPILQSDLRHRLGVPKSVISVMVRALERDGFILRVRCPTDRRTFLLVVTLKGRAAMREIHHDTVVEPYLDLMLRSTFDYDDAPAAVVERRLALLDELTHRFAHAHGRATVNPWIANEDDDGFLHARVHGNPNALVVGPDHSDHPEDETGLADEDDEPFTDEEDPTSPAALRELIATHTDRVRERNRERRRQRRRRARAAATSTTVNEDPRSLPTPPEPSDPPDTPPDR